MRHVKRTAQGRGPDSFLAENAVEALACLGLQVRLVAGGQPAVQMDGPIWAKGQAAQPPKTICVITVESAPKLMAWLESHPSFLTPDAHGRRGIATQDLISLISLLCDLGGIRRTASRNAVGNRIASWLRAYRQPLAPVAQAVREEGR